MYNISRAMLGMCGMYKKGKNAFAVFANKDSIQLLLRDTF